MGDVAQKLRDALAWSRKTWPDAVTTVVHVDDLEWLLDRVGDIYELEDRIAELEHHLNPRPAARPPITGEYAAY